MARKYLDNTTIIALALMAVLAAALLAAPAHAGDSEPAYTMAVFSDTSYGRKVTSGEYAEAIDRITARKYRRRNAFEAKTNLCVAYLKSGDLDNAAQSCDAAIALIREKRDKVTGMSRKVFPEELGYDAYLAMALSNRGVLYAVSGDRERARTDFEEAIDLKAGPSAPKTNLARLDLAVGQSAGFEN